MDTNVDANYLVITYSFFFSECNSTFSLQILAHFRKNEAPSNWNDLFYLFKFALIAACALPK